VDSVVLDISAARLERARSRGADYAFDSKDPEVVQRVLSATHGVGADVSIITYANQSTVSQSAACTRDGGTLCLFAPPPSRENIDLDAEAFFYRELNLISTYSSAPEDLEAALRWIDSRKIDVAPLITGHTDLQGIVAAVSGLAEQDCKIIVHP